MHPVNCKNLRLDVNSTSRECDRFLVALSPKLIAAIKADPDAFMVVRCPSCSKGSRFAQIGSVDGMLVYESVNGHIDLADPVEFEAVSINQQVG